ncbi:hypothetical protein OC842_006277 [Tilletia horrida]|uniref:Uncharacterized protein n=1 Tax=Tilletia horrida TaxID=155126 RepID=A0AAN6JHU0_9BASI|nr:hypothetical protein OC842_006277 [Tilletia horrida]
MKIAVTTVIAATVALCTLGVNANLEQLAVGSRPKGVPAPKSRPGAAQRRPCEAACVNQYDVGTALYNHCIAATC